MKIPNYENLPTINRNALWIEPTAVFLEWAQRFPDLDPELVVGELPKLPPASLHTP